MVYQNVINLLKNRLNSAIYNIGDLLPSEKELAELYDVSRNTLRKALKTLEEEGMIERRHGSGTYLRNKHFQASVTHLDSFTEIAKNEGKT
ncbi:MAG: GntR family transcriptional regulator, partial [Clostridiales bacterium]|nr:GntR family transcriptional regulator [Clostridiales bacterium]